MYVETLRRRQHELLLNQQDFGRKMAYLWEVCEGLGFRVFFCVALYFVIHGVLTLTASGTLAPTFGQCSLALDMLRRMQCCKNISAVLRTFRVAACSSGVSVQC